MLILLTSLKLGNRCHPLSILQIREWMWKVKNIIPEQVAKGLPISAWKLVRDNHLIEMLYHCPQKYHLKMRGVNYQGIRIWFIKKKLGRNKLSYKKRNWQLKSLWINKFKIENNKKGRNNWRSKIWTNSYSKELKRKWMKKRSKRSNWKPKLYNKKA